MTLGMMAGAKKAPLGGGSRFKAISQAASAGGATDGDAVAAAIGRKKYGNTKMQQMAMAGKRSKAC